MTIINLTAFTSNYEAQLKTMETIHDRLAELVIALAAEDISQAEYDAQVLALTAERTSRNADLVAIHAAITAREARRLAAVTD